MFQAVPHRTHELFAHHRAHGSAQKAKLEGAGDNVEARQLAGHDDQRVPFSGLLLGLNQPVLVALGVLELERILRLYLGRNFSGRSGVQKFHDPFASVDAHMVAALRADMQIALDLSLVEHGIASGALGPQPFGHRSRAALGFDPRGYNSLKPRHEPSLNQFGVRARGYQNSADIRRAKGRGPPPALWRRHSADRHSSAPRSWPR